MKAIVRRITLLSTLIGSLALSVNVGAVTFSGNFYLGAGVGFQSLVNLDGGIGNDFSSPAGILPGFPSIETQDDFANQSEGHGVMGDLFLGYGITLNDLFYFGFEGNGELASSPINQTDTSNTSTSTPLELIDVTGATTLKQLSAWGVSFRPGFVIKKVAKIYGIFGDQWGRFSGMDMVTVAIATEPTLTESIQHNGVVNGFRYGLGMEAMIIPHISIRTEFARTSYRTFNVPFDDQALYPGPGTFAFRPVTNDVLFQVVWNMNG